MEAVVMAAGEGTRLRPLTERWAKPVLPIDGRAVLSTLLRELGAAGCERVWLVTGYLAEQVEELAGDGRRFGLEIRFVRQPEVLGSADAVRRALDAGAVPPVLVSAADTVYSRGDVARFLDVFGGSAAAGAVAVGSDPTPGTGCATTIRTIHGPARRSGGSGRRLPSGSAWTDRPMSSRTRSRRRSTRRRRCSRSRSGRRGI
jgi:NDP-sugar pyrophosphorylase family protein